MPGALARAVLRRAAIGGRRGGCRHLAVVASRHHLCSVAVSVPTGPPEGPADRRRRRRRRALSTVTGSTSTTSSSAAAPPAEPSHEDLQRFYRYLALETFDDAELERRVADIALDDPALTRDHLAPYLLRRIRDLEQDTGLPVADDPEEEEGVDARRQAFAALEADRLLRALQGPADDGAGSVATTDGGAAAPLTVPRAAFVARLRARAAAVDYARTAPIIASMLLVGASVGVASPAMPFVVQELQLSSGQFGAVVAAFGLAKMLGNVPAAIAAERHGRKPYVTYSLGLVGLGVAGVGLAGSFEQLYACRLLTGLGVAALSTGGTLMMTDVSTPRNRAATIAPVMSAFSAGAALGPALGGLLVDSVGLHATFYLTGGCFLGVAALNRTIMKETKPRPIVFPWQETRSRGAERPESVARATRRALAQWAPLLDHAGIRSVLIMNGMYWVALAGAQMTLLPLMLTDPTGLAMSATQVGQVYAAMSLVHIFGNPVFARIADRVGKAPAILAGCGLVSASMAGLSVCHTPTDLALALGTWAVGSSMLSTAPVAYVSDRVGDAERAQALALLRTCGDVGFLLGASSIGALADLTGLAGAMQCSAGVLATATLWFATRQDMAARFAALMNKTS